MANFSGKEDILDHQKVKNILQDSHTGLQNILNSLDLQSSLWIQFYRIFSVKLNSVYLEKIDRYKQLKPMSADGEIILKSLPFDYDIKHFMVYILRFYNQSNNFNINIIILIKNNL